jgi:hypothetical protein
MNRIYLSGAVSLLAALATTTAAVAQDWRSQMPVFRIGLLGGENEADRLDGTWDDHKAGLLLLWEPVSPAEHGMEPGQKYIVANGHHRYAFGERQGVRGYNTQIIREADGNSAVDAMNLAA